MFHVFNLSSKITRETRNKRKREFVLWTKTTASLPLFLHILTCYIRAIFSFRSFLRTFVKPFFPCASTRVHECAAIDAIISRHRCSSVRIRCHDTAYPVRGNYAVTIEVYYIIVPISYDTRVRVGRAVVFSARKRDGGRAFAPVWVFTNNNVSFSRHFRNCFTRVLYLNGYRLFSNFRYHVTVELFST